MAAETSFQWRQPVSLVLGHAPLTVFTSFHLLATLLQKEQDSPKHPSILTNAGNGKVHGGALPPLGIWPLPSPLNF
jgi:hypothetical protein